MKFLAEQLQKFTVRITGLMIALVALAMLIAVGFGYTKLLEVTETNAEIRIDRAGRAASSILAHELAGQVAVVRDDAGRPQAIDIVGGAGDEVLQFSPALDALLAEIGLVNQGAANLFKYNSANDGFDRFVTTFRAPDGSMPPPMSLTAGHPAFANLIAKQPFIGEVPVQGRMRLAYLMPIQSQDGSVAGALAVDVGFVDDLRTAASDLRVLIVGGTIAILMLVVGVGTLILRSELRPLRSLAQFANDLALNKNTGAVPHTGRSDEIGDLAQGLARVVEFQRTLSYLAYTDGLTGLGNRSRYLEDLKTAIAAQRRDSVAWLLLHVDVDRFKDFNIAFGQAGGDELIKQLGAALHSVLGNSALISRLGADQFVVLVPEARRGGRQSAIETSLLERLHQPFKLGGTNVHLTVSIGALYLDGTIANPDEAHLNADLALRRAKQDGGNRCVVFANEMYMVVQTQIRLEQMLRRAIAASAIDVHFQPQIDPNTVRLTGLEALARWSDEDGRPVSPSEFIPVAEATGLIVELGALMLEKVCGQAREWLDAGFEFGCISVNVSPMQLWHPDFEHIVRDTLERHALAGRYICLEVTESLFVDKAEGQVGRILGRLKKLGVSIALDDFGAGYSSLGYLNHLPFDQLKIDRSFVQNATDDGNDRQLLAGIISIGKGLGLFVVAEGAETAAEVANVAALGCDSVQGFYYARPMPAADIPNSVSRLTQAKPKPTRKRRPAKND